MGSMSNGQDKEMDEKKESGKVYELGYLLVPSLSEEEVSAKYGDLKDTITSKYKGEVISDDMPKMIDLAYTMKKMINNVHSKFENAYFGWIKFEMEGSDLVEFKKKLDLDTTIIRFLITKTVRENTIATKRFVQRGGLKRTFVMKKPDEVEMPINKEEVDKEIDALIAP